MLRAMASDTPSICWSCCDGLLLHLLELGVADDVELPARQLRGEAHVLPLAPDGEESFSSGTTSSMRPSASSTMTLFTSAGWMAAHTKRAGSRSYGTMSIFSPRSSCTTACTREPFMPTHAPTGSTSASRLVTAIFERAPGSRAQATIFTMPS
jgi:hypothetical protein